LNRRFVNLKKAEFSVGQEAENDFKITFNNWIHNFFEYIKIASWAGQEAENEFAVPYNH